MESGWLLAWTLGMSASKGRDVVWQHMPFLGAHGTPRGARIWGASRGEAGEVVWEEGVTGQK
jgi:hypothetical protein